MKALRKIVSGLMLLVCLSASTLVRAQEQPLSDSAHISLLTVSAGDEIYAHYGHTAIRVCDPVRGFDLVFNYGLFDFNSPNFLYRFVRGETDYLCGAGDFRDFLIEYQLSNRTVSEQVLNLQPIERERIWQALVWNIQPENRSYRYNFFFNNCATKPRDIIVSNLDGTVEYHTQKPFGTLRDEIHHYTKAHPWTQFGIDFLIGAPADGQASLKDEQFAPTVLQQSFDQAVVRDQNGSNRKLVASSKEVVSLDPSLEDNAHWAPSPLLVCWVLFGLMLLLTGFELHKKKTVPGVTEAWYGLFGITGSLIAFMVLFSEHPATNINFLLLWQHPFQFSWCRTMLLIRRR